ncbi:MAG TPA: prolyl oligopeptidase family serine peptidase [Thermoanaerobaculia bacterium]|nr:prolyl oligopeptidase family serine peptidase [Thermoanaerobaculia bacterium]
MKRFILLVLGFAAVPLCAQTVYKLPPKEIVDVIDAAPFPEAVVSPARDAMLLVEAEGYPPIAVVSRPILRLGGLRISPAIGARQRLRRFTGISVQRFDGGPARSIAVPAGARIGLPVWSHDGKSLAFERDVEDGVELWVADAATGQAHAVSGVRVNDVLGRSFAWMADGRRLLVRAVPAGRGPAPAEPPVPRGPRIQETAGKVSLMATFEDLLKDAHDEDLFAHYAAAQLSIVDAASGAATKVGEPGVLLAAEFSPDERYIVVTQLKRPYSYRVPYTLFARAAQVWDASGRTVATIADLPISDEIPRQGVPTGPRSLDWQPLKAATLVWAEAMDGGDPLKKVPQRDRLMRLAAPFSGAPAEFATVQHRFTGIGWSARPDLAIVNEFERDRRWRRTLLVDVSMPGSPQKVLFDLSAQDAYKDPGAPVYETRPDGQRVALQDGETFFLSGAGASPEGDRPFLDRLDWRAGKTDRLFRCGERVHEQFLAFVKGSKTTILTRRESPAEPPNYFLVDLKSGKRTRVTDSKDRSPLATRISKQLVTYARKDGVPLSGTLYLPPDAKPGTRLPVLIWAYPLEFSDAGTAGQVRGSPWTFNRLAGPSPLFFALEGYAVLNDATMPVLGDPETVNNTYVEQITESARAAIEKLDAMGVGDPKRVCIAGHSYGAFMTANLLAHTDLFAAGIARSGAYNRSLTPFGFQSERRSYWEATELYTKISPFTYANKIKAPLLLIHGEADDNSGTFPVQSERLFEAVRGNGGTARLVMLPAEPHGYRARESILHTLAEMLEWADRWVKNRPAAKTAAAN